MVYWERLPSIYVERRVNYLRELELEERGISNAAINKIELHWLVPLMAYPARIGGHLSARWLRSAGLCGLPAVEAGQREQCYCHCIQLHSHLGLLLRWLTSVSPSCALASCASEILCNE